MSPPSPRPPSSGVPCLEKATDLLARHSHFRRQLAAKLSQRGYPGEEIEAALDRLTELGYLDDLRTAEEFVALRRGRGEGRRRIHAELSRRGASEDVISAVLASLPEDDLSQAREVARAWLRRKGGAARSQALARHLDRKGFSQRAVLEILDEGLEALASPEADFS